MTELSFLDIQGVPNEVKEPVRFTGARPLSRADRDLRESRRGQLDSYLPPLKRITHRHHALARALASGLSPADAAAVCGYALSTVSMLRRNPAFIELVNFFAREVNDKFLDMQAGMAALGVDAVETLHTRLETDPESFSNRDLTQLVTSMADRTGNGPASTSVQVNIHAGLAERLEAARKRAAEASKLIEGTPVEGGADGL